MEREKDIEVSEAENNESSETEVIDEQETEIIDEEAEVLNDADHELQAELDKIAAENEQLRDRMLRAQAEFENYKRRTEKEKLAERKYKAQELASELLPVMDNFERALQTEINEENKGFYDGVQMVYEQLKNALESQEITPIEALNESFDPNVHHAVMQVEEEDTPSNTVVEELQKGYMLKDRVIRPAMVKVNK